MSVKITKPAINLREKLSELDKQSGIVGEVLLRSQDAAEANEVLGTLSLVDGAYESAYTGVEIDAAVAKLPTSSTDNAIVRFDGTTGQVQNSNATVDDNGTIIAPKFNVQGTYPQITFSDTDNNPDYMLITDAGSFRLYDSSNGAYRLFVSNVGNVGIGTTTPASTLDVNGTVTTAGDVYIGGSSYGVGTVEEFEGALNV